MMNVNLNLVIDSDNSSCNNIDITFSKNNANDELIDIELELPRRIVSIKKKDFMIMAKILSSSE